MLTDTKVKFNLIRLDSSERNQVAEAQIKPKRPWPWSCHCKITNPFYCIIAFKAIKYLFEHQTS